MRTRVGILALTLAAVLSACSSDSGSDADAEKSPSAPLTEISVECEKFADTAKKITDAQTELYSATGSSAAIDSLVAELEELKEGAPDDVKEALTDMGAAFRDAEKLLANPTEANTAEFARLAPKLADDGQKISAYIVSECG